jgi:hypothetical protein
MPRPLCSHAQNDERPDACRVCWLWLNDPNSRAALVRAAARARRTAKPSPPAPAPAPPRPPCRHLGRVLEWCPCPNAAAAALRNVHECELYDTPCTRGPSRVRSCAACPEHAPAGAA